MRITIRGTGGVGGYFGAHLAAIREHGVPIESPRGKLHLREVQVTERPADPATA